MIGEELEVELSKAKQGNEWVRERLIRHYKPYVINIVGHVCKRFVSWSDEEASIGLIALNRAIDTYRFDGGRTFSNYVYLLVKRDLVSYFRKTKAENHFSLDDAEESVGDIQHRASLETYEQSQRSFAVAEEILELERFLALFGLSFEELEHFSPKHQRTRKRLREMASRFAEDRELTASLLKYRRFPITAFVNKTGASRKMIERHRKYLLALIIIKLHPEWHNLSEYTKTPSRGDLS